ncbi:hypothetical protein SDC9_72037 [bioreactor metagenome]|uniref:Peptidase S8/S53 domain-containing protein n=1 Tax=bioreactor metagenome TaxID=1076179 RepID=A0A644YCB6_9ZZZZ
MRNYRLSVFVPVPLLILSITITMVSFYHSNNPLTYKQWYLSNNGDKECIEDCDDPYSYIPIETGIDIGYDRMTAMLKEADLDKEVVVAIIDSGVDFRRGFAGCKMGPDWRYRQSS